MAAPEVVRTRRHDPRRPDREGQVEAEAILPLLALRSDGVIGAFLTPDHLLRPEDADDLLHIHYHPDVVALSAGRHPVTGSPSVDEIAEVEVVHFLDPPHLPATVVVREVTPDHCHAPLPHLVARLDDATLQTPALPGDVIPLHPVPHVAKIEIGVCRRRDLALRRVAGTMVEEAGVGIDRCLVRPLARRFQREDVRLSLPRVRDLHRGLHPRLRLRVDNAAALEAPHDVVPLGGFVDVQEHQTFCEGM